MFRLHTQWTTDFAVRLVQPIEDWLNYRCPIVPRQWFDKERTSRQFLESDFHRMMESVEKDYRAQTERDLYDHWPAFDALITMETSIERNEKVVQISFSPRRRFIPLRVFDREKHSPEYFKYLTKTAGDWAKRDVEIAVAEALAQMQTKEATK